MPASVTVEGKVAGRRRPLFSDWSVPLPSELETGGRITLRDLIARVVLEELAAFRERREERRFARVLSAAEIEEGALRGKIDAGGREEPEGDVDPGEAVETALLAFKDGLYYVFVNDEQQTELEAPLSLQPGSRVTFLRLVALAGG